MTLKDFGTTCTQKLFHKVTFEKKKKALSLSVHVPNRARPGTSCWTLIGVILVGSTFHHWPGVSCSPLSQGLVLHQPLLPLQLKLKDLAVRQQRCPGQRVFQNTTL